MSTRLRIAFVAAGVDSANKRTRPRRAEPALELIVRLEALGCDPVGGMARIAMDVATPVELPARTFAELAQHFASKRKAIDHELNADAAAPIGPRRTTIFPLALDPDRMLPTYRLIPRAAGNLRTQRRSVVACSADEEAPPKRGCRQALPITACADAKRLDRRVQD